MRILPQALWTITWVLSPLLTRLLSFHEVTLWREMSKVKRTTPASATCARRGSIYPRPCSLYREIPKELWGEEASKSTLWSHIQ